MSLPTGSAFDGPPRVASLLHEVPRAVIELQHLALVGPLLQLAPRGDGHPVLVIPGFLAHDWTTAPMRYVLRSIGYSAHRWRLGRNLGPTQDVVTGLLESVRSLNDKHGRAVSLLGWSLGGNMARELARIEPARVRQVITICSPIAMRELGQSRVSSLYTHFRGRHHDDYRDIERLLRHPEPLAVPSTTIFTRRDGVVAWRSCVQTVDQRSENIEILGSHLSAGNQPSALLAISDRLSQPDGSWKPFRPPAVARGWYPRPAGAQRRQART